MTSMGLDSGSVVHYLDLHWAALKGRDLESLDIQKSMSLLPQGRQSGLCILTKTKVWQDKDINDGEECKTYSSHHKFIVTSRSQA